MTLTLQQTWVADRSTCLVEAFFEDANATFYFIRASDGYKAFCAGRHILCPPANIIWRLLERTLRALRSPPS